MTRPNGYLTAVGQLRNELLPISFIELSSDSLILGGSLRCTTLNDSDLAKLIIALVTIQRELHERQMP